MLKEDQIIVTVDRVEALQASVLQLQSMVGQLLSENKKIGDWIPEKEVMKITGINSRGTLRKLRNEGKISGSKLAGKTNWYRRSDFEKLLNKNEENI